MLDISPVLMVSSAIIFLLVLARLNSCLFKPLLKHMDERSESIKKDLENAKSNAADVDGMLAEANEVIAAAKREAAAIREKAQSEAQSVATGKLESAKSEIEGKYNDFISSMDSEIKSLKDTLTSQLPLYKESLKAKISSI